MERAILTEASDFLGFLEHLRYNLLLDGLVSHLTEYSDSIKFI